MKRLVSIQDISCFGKCSLTVALPIISACGVETAILPTAVLSTHTSGFEGYVFKDMSKLLPEIANHWKNIDMKFDAIYIGYLGGEAQIDFVFDFIQKFKTEATLLLVDPVMGDGGRLYEGYTTEYVEKMKKLCALADIITPNLTEAALLTGILYQNAADSAYYEGLLDKLEKTGAKKIALTSAACRPGSIGALCSDGGRKFEALTPVLRAPKYGAGDVFTSVLAGAYIKTGNFEESVSCAVEFTERSIKATAKELDSHWYGLCFEEALPWLAEKIQGKKV